MAELYDVTTSTSITPIVESLTPKRLVNQVQNYALDGTFYMQIIGTAAVQYDVICYAPRTQTILVENAWTLGDTFRITMSHGTYYGKIIEFQKSELPQQYFKMELTLARVNAPTESEETP